MAMTLLSSSNQGFSFLSVLFLLVILSATVTVGYMSLPPVQRENQSALTFKRMEEVRAAIIAYQQHHSGSSPATLNALVTATGPACSAITTPSDPNYKSLTGWCGPYLIQNIGGTLFNDGWGTPLELSASTLTSCGPNRTCGDSDDVALGL